MNILLFSENFELWVWSALRPRPDNDWPLRVAPRPRPRGGLGAHHQAPGEHSAVVPRAPGVGCLMVTRCHDQDALLETEETDGICLGSGSGVGGHHCYGPGVCTRHSLAQTTDTPSVN